MFQNFQKYPYLKTTRFKDIRKEENPTSKRRRAGNSQNISGPKNYSTSKMQEAIWEMTPDETNLQLC